MTNALTVFNFQDANVRTVTLDGEPYFVAKDVAEILGYSDTAKAVKSHCKGYRPVGVGVSPTLIPSTNVIPERDVYRLVMRSKLPGAEAFEEFVVGEVLPAIRKTGSFSVAPRDPLSDIDRLIPAIASGMGEIRTVIEAQTARIDLQADRLTAVEERQKEIDPQVIDAFRVKLHQCKELLVKGTEKKPQAVTYPGFWRELKAHCKVGSFAIENQAALTVPLMEKAFAYAVKWCKARGVKASTLFDDVPANA